MPAFAGDLLNIAHVKHDRYLRCAGTTGTCAPLKERTASCLAVCPDSAVMLHGSTAVLLMHAPSSASVQRANSLRQGGCPGLPQGGSPDCQRRSVRAAQS